MENKTDNITDRKIRELLKKSRFDAPPSPWFTRKVMNRLPNKKVKVLAWIEYAVYAAAAFLTAILGLNFGINAFLSGTVRLGDIAVMATYMGVFCAIIILIVSPWLKTGRESD